MAAVGDPLNLTSTVTLNIVSGAAPVPEPSTVLLLSSGVLGLAVAVRRKRFKDVRD